MGNEEGGSLAFCYPCWVNTIDWWAVILMALFVLLACAIWRTKGDALAFALLVLGIISIVTALAYIYPTPQDFIIFWE